MAADGEILTFLKYFGLRKAAGMGMGMAWHGTGMHGHDLARTIYFQQRCTQEVQKEALRFGYCTHAPGIRYHIHRSYVSFLRLREYVE